MDDGIPIKLIRNNIFGVVGGIVLLLTSCSSFYTVEQGERGIHTRLGALTDVTAPGPHLKVPFIDKVPMIEVRDLAIKWELDGRDNTDSRMNTYSRDQQPAEIAVTVVWDIPADKATITEIFNSYGSRERLRTSVMIPKTVEAVKNVFGTYDAVTVIQQRSKFNADVAIALNKLLEGYPVGIKAVQVQDISFSDEYEAAVEARMMAQVEVQKREQQKQTSQIDADIAVIKAEAEAKQIKLDGEARASVVRVRGEAEADAIRARAQALAQNANLVQLTAAERWNGALPTTMVPGSAVPFVNIPK